MSKKKTEGGTKPTQWVIRILILLIFIVAIVIGANRLMEWNRLRQRGEELQEQKDSYEEVEDTAGTEQEP